MNTKSRIVTIIVLKIYVLASILTCAIIAGQAQTLFKRGISPNGPIFSMERKGNILYAGGSFDKVGYITGGAAYFNDNDTLPELDFPYIAGEVYSIVPDGKGGWFVGGNFESAGAKLYKYLVHILPDFEIDTLFQPQLNNMVRAMTLKDNILYFGGEFNLAGNETRKYLAAYNVSTNTLTSFDPKPNNYIHDLKIYKNSLIIGGNFSKIDTASYTALAKINLNTGIAEPVKFPPNGRVHALLLKGDTLYVGGTFTEKLMAINLTDNTVLGWSASLSGFGVGQQVNALAIIDTLIYFGGAFAYVNGQSRTNLAALTVSGNLTTFSPNPDYVVNSLFADGNDLFVGGTFKKIANDSIPFAVKLNVNSGKVYPWNIRPNYAVNTFVKDENALLIGGEFEIFQYVERNNAFALDLNNYKLLAWHPVTNFLTVSEIKVDKTRDVVYLSGWDADKLKAVDGTTGKILPGWSIPANLQINSIVPDSATGNIYIGGNFTSIKGVSRNRVAALSPDGSLLPFNVDIDNEVRDITISSNNNIYLAGEFNYVNGVERLLLAAVDINGTLLNWYPITETFQSSFYYTKLLVPYENQIYIAGYYYEVNGISRTGASLVDSETGSLMLWDIKSNVNEIDLIKPFNNGLIVSANRLAEINSDKVNYIAFVGKNTGKIIFPIPDFGFNSSNSISAYETLDTLLIAGGSFRWLNNKYHPYLSFIAFPRNNTADTVSTSIRKYQKPISTIYPNPVKDVLVIQPGFIGESIISLINMQGKKIELSRSKLTQKENIKINVNGIPKGIYLLEIETVYGKETHKFLKE